MRKEAVGTAMASFFGKPWILVLLGLLAVVATERGSLPTGAFAALSLLVLLGTRAWAALGLWRLEVELSCDGQRLFCGDTLGLRARISNRKGLPVTVRVDLAGAGGLDQRQPGETGGLPGEAQATEDQAGGELRLGPFEEAAMSWSFFARRRGLHRLGPARVVAGDLFGLASRGRSLPFQRDIVVFPRILTLAPLEPPFREFFGVDRSKGLVEDPSCYEGTREYTGDKPAKYIHWKASARLASLQEKIFEPTSHRKVYFLLDGTSFVEPEDSGRFEEALEILATLASRFAETGASFGIATDRLVRGYPALLPLGRGPEHLGKLLELLARCENRRERPISEFLPGLATGGAGFVILCRSPEEPGLRFAVLPLGTKDRGIFVFAEGGEKAKTGTWPSMSFRDLRLATPGQE